MDRSKGQPFEYSFMDDAFNKQYASDQRTGQIFISFSLFAIFIACLGLFGLVNYSAEVRTKEIGIRKVLRLVLLAAAIALLTICFRTIKAAVANPIDSLRVE
jgi:hypothetical protein